MQTLLRPSMNSIVVKTVTTLSKLALVSFLLLYLVLVSLPTPTPYTGHFHTPVKHVHNLSSNILEHFSFQKPNNISQKYIKHNIRLFGPKPKQKVRSWLD